MCTGDAGADVMLDCAGDHDWTWGGLIMLAQLLGDILQKALSVCVHTTVASVHISNQGRPKGVQVGNHVCVVPHVGELGNSEVRLAKTRSGCAGAGLSSQPRVSKSRASQIAYT